METLLNVLASGIGSFTNPNRISNTFASERHVRVAPDTIDNYIEYFLEAYLIQKAERYDVKGRKYIRTPVKYYYSDVGLRNARLGFRQLEETHLMENVLFNDPVKKKQEIASLIRIPDSFRKIVVVKDYIKPWQDEKGIQYIGIEDFLLEEKYISR